MLTMSAQPNMNQLFGFISEVPTYPITVRQLLGLASKKGAPQDVINFYRAFSPDVVFESADDLSARSEQVEIMKSEELQMPKEDAYPDEY